MSNLINRSRKSPMEYLTQARGGLWPTIKQWGVLTLRSLQDALAPESQLVASSIGYYTLFSVFPLALLVVAIASN